MKHNQDRAYAIQFANEQMHALFVDEVRRLEGINVIDLHVPDLWTPPEGYVKPE